ncbi:hypothetical protein KCV01_g9276, partial [Aureobasidium melanogenum]
MDVDMTAEAIAMTDRPGEQPGNRGQADMRVRAYVHAGVFTESRGAHLVEEDEGPDVAGLQVGQHAPHDETVAEIALLAVDKIHGHRHTPEKLLPSVTQDSLSVPQRRSAIRRATASGAFIQAK